MSRLSKFLKSKRKKAGLTQQEVAAHLGLDSPQYISNAERGVSGLCGKHYKRLAKLYKFDAKELSDILIKDYKDQLKRYF